MKLLDEEMKLQSIRMKQNKMKLLGDEIKLHDDK